MCLSTPPPGAGGMKWWGIRGAGIRNYTSTWKVSSLEGLGKARRYRAIGGRVATGERRPRPLQAPSPANHRRSGPDAPPGATHRPQRWPAGRSTAARAPAGAAAATKSSLGQPRSRRAEKRNTESERGRRNAAGRLVLALVGLIRPVLQCSLKGQMADERTELQSFHSAAEISFISLPCGCGCSFAQDRVPRPPKVKACLWGEAGRQEESPAVISLVVSRYQKNIQVWEKTYPGCRGVGSGDSRGAEDQHKFPTAGKGETGRGAAAPGGPRRIACAPAGQDSF